MSQQHASPRTIHYNKLHKIKIRYKLRIIIKISYAIGKYTAIYLTWNFNHAHAILPHSTSYE